MKHEWFSLYFMSVILRQLFTLNTKKGQTLIGRNFPFESTKEKQQQQKPPLRAICKIYCVCI